MNREQKKQPYKAVIFDLDGTILDTLEDLADSTNAALKMHDMPVKTVQEIRAYVGNGIRRLIEQAVPLHTSEEEMLSVLADFSAYYKVHCADQTKPYDGICDLIRKLKDAGIMTAVVSNKADFAVQSLCDQYFPQLFDLAVGEKEGIRRKPYPDSVLEVLKSLKTAREDAVYVGDSEVDIQTADNAGMDRIIVTWGFRDEKQLRDNGAKRIVHDREELRKLLLVY